MKKRVIILALASVVRCIEAGAQSAPKPESVTFNTNKAGDLADTCEPKATDPAASVKRTFCQGFAQGAISVELKHAGAHKPFCFSKPAPARAETMKLFVQWVGKTPERRVLSSTDGLFRFLGEQYPCKPTQPTTPGESGKS
jgi:Rap1a immunity proteins